MEIENIHTFERYLKSGINLFTGAGFSLLSEDSTGKPLPKGSALKDELLTAFPGTPSALELPQMCTLISKTKKDELYSYLYNRFSVYKFDNIYKNIASIEIKNVFTTNIDNLFQKIFESSPTKYINDANLNGASFHDKQAIDYFYMHGSVLDKESPLIFGDLDIASAFSHDPARWNYLSSLMGRFPTLFWGYALKDAGTLQSFSHALNEHNQKDSWIILHPDYIKDGEVDYYKSIGLKIIKSNTEDFLKYLQKFDSETSKENTSLVQSVHPFPEYSVPSNSSIEHRSIQDYFQGASPIWSDIYSPRVGRVRFYDQIQETLNKGKNILITGGPATGKTTLLMQLAAFYDFNGFKIYTKDISKEKAKTIASGIGQTPALFLIDEFQSSIDALETLSKIGNIRLVISERDYAYLSSSNSPFLSKSITVFDVTELDEADAQMIINNIPSDIKAPNIHKLSDGDSLFELIEKNCKTPNIKSRFNNVIKELRTKDDKLVGLFLLICYLHTSRSIASMDVLISYFSDSVKDYKGIYDLIDILGSSITECAGELVEKDQDYFNIRSNMLADLIYKISPTEDLARMLTTFHSNVSTYSIPNYKAFKRRAYDARLFERAFPDIRKGGEVYDVIYKKHQSPFNLQQKSLYLSRRGEHQEAFRVIDEAISLAGSRNWSIKNSYAIIKFRANISRDNSADVRKALDESMGSLEECHSLDIRKTFHAMTYADHSLQYWNKYRDIKSLGCVNKAIAWLEEEQKNNKGVGNVVRLSRELNRAALSFK